ncbi:hypothetical protein ACFQRL_09065 [Microbacterium fluvii]|uniref:DinB family protein n=1 Tax=Microbacterium fluvii TaxID=415215 RepID=A0ABW2HF23_9MICO|nr:hypothetical protein [Microbacterium fluvii]MCU4672738.1 hypothetical protein [Microbacterium fluvii]
MTDLNAALALQVLTGYHEVQHTIDELLAAKYRSLGGFGGWMAKRANRLTDGERRGGLLAIASDAGLAERVKHVPNVLGDVKAVRDSLAHSMTLHMVDEGVRGFKDGDLFSYSSAQLELTAWRIFWVLEHVLHTAEVADLSPAAPFNIVRRSGVRLVDAPPTVEPPARPIEDPSRIPRFDLRHAQMNERERRSQESSAP